MKELFSSVKNKSTIVATSALVFSCSAVNCFADDSVTTSMTTALTAVKTDALGAISAVAPIALGIMGVFLVWKYGIRFFKSVSK
ncbi:hypothetical protein [Clostridioides difficile]|uniref:hypothetical protein n=1 Tax=Clostridioides difficile TaxID=1496 RepID=UPI000B3C5AF2|nr:hypothetical protein [Clostridioides difficile]TLE37811.1 hypothetical protein EDC95_18110 [Clostridioides difficile]